MQLKHLLIAVGLVVLVWGGILLYNYLMSESTLDYRLGKQAHQDMLDRPDVFGDNVVGFDLVEPGVYRIEVTGFSDAQLAGRMAYNAMAVLVMAKWEMQCSRHIFTIYGYQDEELIFEVNNTRYDEPIVTLMGPFEGIEYIPSFTKKAPEFTPVEPDRPGVESRQGIVS